MTPIDFNGVDFVRELKTLQAESMGWIPLEKGAYLHRGAQPGTAQDSVVEIVGVMVDASLVDCNVLWLV